HRASHFNPDILEPEVAGFPVDLPAWTETLTRGNSSAKSLLGAPVLASTVDYLIDAGNPGRQGKHVSALLRLLSSDLILDEIDSYDPSAMGAVLRLVFMAGFCGRNLICSSATLSDVLAQSVVQAYNRGRQSGYGLTHYEGDPSKR